MAEKKVTMVMRVDLGCYRCYKKIKKVMCKFPEIRDQIYDEKQNRVLISVVSCCPERILEKIASKGGKTVESIGIVPEKKPEKKHDKKDGDKKWKEEGNTETTEATTERGVVSRRTTEDSESSKAHRRACFGISHNLSQWNVQPAASAILPRIWRRAILSRGAGLLQ
ncbi:heavy metal-associated isoprenylated plant protein 6 [Eucalyptus grandis]|uniref:heavy metal-associated isoprenylated plant protein 6 n=1 Tax=Eucalyptus grandis TaxID=71139 RepID=UPI00192EFB54|nr:heavy metal-associated isoprenylated plant protein 6 [Eucalyptus grandis]